MSIIALTVLALNPSGLVPADLIRDRTVAESNADVSDQVSVDDASGWLDSYEAGRKLAMQRKAPLLLHFEAVWCGACRTMESGVLNQPDVMKIIGHDVVGVRVDADRSRDLIAKYGISSLPTEVVISADGEELERFEGGVALASYVRRLTQLTSASDSENEQKVAAAEQEQSVDTRSCLIVERGGQMVGLGGFSPVALTTSREWIRGSAEFIVKYEGVDYFLQSAEEVVAFTDTPEKFIPRLHGCDLVTLSQNGKVEPGAIEFGSFYKGEVYFFTNLLNRDRFQRNPEWYATAPAVEGVDPARDISGQGSSEL